MKLLKIFLSSALLFTLINCKTKKTTLVLNNEEKEVVVKQVEVIVPLDSNELKGLELMKDSILVGKITIQELMNEPFVGWFNKEYLGYKLDRDVLDDFANNPKRLDALSIKIYLGTWCSDSRREVPRFYKMLQYLHTNKFEIIALDKDKRTSDSLEKGMNIHHVPTFILYQNGKEINRIIETPVETLEKDIISIVQKGIYIPNYIELEK